MSLISVTTSPILPSCAIMESGEGVRVGSEIVHAVIYADDISPINPGSTGTN